MSTCNVHIELAEPGPVPTGHRLRGNVVVDVSDDVRADAVVLELTWYTHGRGNRQNTVVESLTLPGAPWSAGHQVRAPFEFQIPEVGPITYRGTLINLDWRVRARVDLPWKIDPRTAEDFVVVAGEKAKPFLSVPGATGPALGRRLEGCALLFLAPFLIVGLVILVGGLTAGDPGRMAAGVAFVVIPGGMAWFLLWRRLALRAVDHAALILPKRRVLPGEEFAAHLDLPRRVARRLEGVTAELVGVEIAVSGSGTKSSTHRHEVARIPLPVDCQDDAMHIRCLARGRVPHDAVPTLRVSDNQVRWEIHVRVKLRGRLDPAWEEELIVDVIRPPAREGGPLAPEKR